jgi:signal transduction histidine kinase/DNA-binding response OmpR family regulator/sugar lactone lactonase YvrE
MKSIKITLLLWVLLLPVGIFPANDIYFSKIGIEQGLSQLSVMTIYQDELGALWFGTREGVNRYNGHSMEVFRPEPNDSNSLNGSLIKKITGNKNGLIYIHSQNGLNEFNLRSRKMRRIQKEEIDAIAQGVSKLWVAEKNKIYTYDTGKKEFYTEISDPDIQIRVLLETADQRLVVGTVSSGLYIIDQNKKIRQVLKTTSQISSVFEDSKKNIWVGTWLEGLYKIERSGNIVQYLPGKTDFRISSEFVRAICEDSNGFIWVGTKKGLDRLNPESGNLKHYDSDEYNNRSLSNESVWALLRDSQGSIWVGTYFGGVNFFNPDIDFYSFHDLRSGELRNKPFPIISEIVEDNQQQLYLCTEGNGLIHYNPATRTYKTISHIPGNPNTLTGDNIKTCYFDRANNELWLGMHLGGVSKVDIRNGKITQFRHLKPEWEQSDIVRAIVPYEGNLLIATYNGLFLLNKSTGQISLFSEKLHKTVSYFVDLKIDARGNFWIASRGLYRYNPKTGKTDSWFFSMGDSTSLSNNNTMKILIDSKQRIWIATNGGGVNLYKPETNSFVRYSSANSGLKNDYISNLAESRYGYLLIATTQGFSMLDAENNKISNYGPENGFPLNSLFNGGMHLTAKGEIFIAGMNGMVSFNEENLSSPRRSFNLNLTSLWINNKAVEPGDETNVLDISLPFTESIKLNHRQTMITIEFASNNYIAANQPVYRYRLEGFSDVWTDLPQGINKLNFMNLNEGKYRLLVEAFSPNDGEVIARTGLGITVYPPFYRAWYAYLFYVLLIVLASWRLSVFSRSKLLLKTSLEYEKKEKAHLEEVNQSKLRFFTNISHEFRTPLTLIKGQVDMLLQMHNIQPSVYNRILNIKRNTLTMQNLINELLEFRKTEQGHLQIRVSEHDFVKFIYEVYLSFNEYAAYRAIKFDFDCKEEKIPLWFDASQMQKVFYNLVSNAFKYTPKDGTIGISVTEQADRVEVKITDSGVGISAEAIEKIFDRFYQAENGLQISNMAPGTGIGLALTKSILETHQAEIHVESQPQVGSIFTVTLKKGSAHFSEDQKVTQATENEEYLQQVNEIDDEFMQEVKSTQLQNNETVYSMLIVEDNDELREMLKSIFEPIYKIYTAANGLEGLEMTIEHQPDIVLSDLMMPEMSGSEMCSKIKNNFQVCHIPVVLLTAQTAVEYNIEGLRLGADDYITKPFNVKTLITRCNNLVNNRRILQDKFTKQTGFSPRMIATNKMDLEFLERAQQIVEQHLDDSEFDVPAFSREIALGRTKLFTKLKGITGQTPNEFIQNVRLKKAASLLSNNPEYNISDITYMLGFSSPKYFAKCFKEQFGVSPSAYRKGDDSNEEEEEED